MAYKKPPQEEEIRFSGITKEQMAIRYRYNKQGKPVKRIDTKEEQDKIKAENAKIRIENSALLKVDSTEAGIKAIINWRDEDGEGFKSTDFIIRTKTGDGDLLVYEGKENIIFENYEEEIRSRRS